MSLFSEMEDSRVKSNKGNYSPTKSVCLSCTFGKHRVIIAGLIVALDVGQPTVAPVDLNENDPLLPRCFTKSAGY